MGFFSKKDMSPEELKAREEIKAAKRAERQRKAQEGMATLAQMSAESKAKKEFKKSIHCPHCKSQNVQFMQNKRKGFSAGKAVGGAILTGGIGTLAGFAGKDGNNQWVCMSCGRTFETKNK